MMRQTMSSVFSLSSSTAPKHFIDLSEIPTTELRAVLDSASAMKNHFSSRMMRSQTVMDVRFS